MRRRVVSMVTGLLAGLSVVAVTGCGGAEAQQAGAAATLTAAPSRTPEVPAPGDHALTLAWQGRERAYHLHAPPGFQPADRPPLVVVLPYRFGKVEDMRVLTRFDAKADREGLLVAYPAAVNGSLNALICCGELDDVGFVRALVEHVVAAWGADPGRVYATGMSNGADMVFRLAVEAPGLFAAIAPVSGGFVGNKATDDASFKPQRPVSVVSFLGIDDRSYERSLAGVRAWRTKLDCEQAPAEWADAGQTVARTASTCADGSDLVSYTIKGMSHSWPGGDSADRMADATTRINAVDAMWAFFAAHPRRS